MQTTASVLIHDCHESVSLKPAIPSIDPMLDRRLRWDAPAITGATTSSGFGYSSLPFVRVSVDPMPISRQDDAFLRRAILRGGRLVARGRLSEK
jgi:hypothetical protein